MRIAKRKDEKSDAAGESPGVLERRISEIERALQFSRAFLDQLSDDDEGNRRRLEEIAFTYERELDRLRSKKRKLSDARDH